MLNRSQMGIPAPQSQTALTNNNQFSQGIGGLSGSQQSQPQQSFSQQQNSQQWFGGQQGGYGFGMPYGYGMPYFGGYGMPQSQTSLTAGQTGLTNQSQSGTPTVNGGFGTQPNYQVPPWFMGFNPQMMAPQAQQGIGSLAQPSQSSALEQAKASARAQMASAQAQLGASNQQVQQTNALLAQKPQLGGIYGLQQARANALKLISGMK